MAVLCYSEVLADGVNLQEATAHAIHFACQYSTRVRLRGFSSEGSRRTTLALLLCDVTSTYSRGTVDK
jgi:hypothetical protein